MAYLNGEGYAGLNRRLTALEKRVGKDDDLPGSIIERLGAQGRMLQAMSETLSDHTRTLNEHSVILGKLLWGMTEIKNLLHSLQPGAEDEPGSPRPEMS